MLWCINDLIIQYFVIFFYEERPLVDVIGESGSEPIPNPSEQSILN